MKNKKIFLPLLTVSLLAFLGLSACNGSNNENSQKSDETSISSEVEEEVAIKVTAEGDKKDLVVGETVRLHADQEGVSWSTRNEDIVSVSDTGLVTALAAGSARVTARKDGFASGSITLTVQKAPEKAAKYTLPMEDADHYSPTDTWGASYRTAEEAVSPVHSNNGATEDGTNIGYFANGCKETLTFTSDKAFKAEIGVTMAYNTAMSLETRIKVTFNGAEISMAGKTTEAPSDGDTNNYYEFHTISFGEQDIVNGSNVLVIDIISSQAPNLDEFKIFTDVEANIAVVKPVVLEKISVTPASLTLTVGDAEQLVTETTGVTYESSDATVATVSETGLVTAVAAGNAEITVSKEGMRSATVSVKVKAQQVATTYDLVAGSAVRMEFENGEFYCDAGEWGMTYGTWHIGPNHDGGETPIEDVESASGGMSLGYFNQSSKVTLKFNSPKAGTASFVLCGAYNRTYALEDNVSIKVNDVEIDVTGKEFVSTSYTDWVTVDLGNVAVNSGLNTFVLEIIGSQGPNLDYVEATLA